MPRRHTSTQYYLCLHVSVYISRRYATITLAHYYYNLYIILECYYYFFIFFYNILLYYMVIRRRWRRWRRRRDNRTRATGPGPMRRGRGGRPTNGGAAVARSRGGRCARHEPRAPAAATAAAAVPDRQSATYTRHRTTVNTHARIATGHVAGEHFLFFLLFFFFFFLAVAVAVVVILALVRRPSNARNAPDTTRRAAPPPPPPQAPGRHNRRNIPPVRLPPCDTDKYLQNPIVATRFTVKSALKIPNVSNRTRTDDVVNY